MKHDGGVAVEHCNLLMMSIYVHIIECLFFFVSYYCVMTNI